MKKLRDMLYLVKEGVCACSFVQLFVMALMVACQAPLSVGFFRQEYWSGLPLLSPGDLPNPGIEPGSPALQVDALPSQPPEKSLYFAMYIAVGQVT